MASSACVLARRGGARWWCSATGRSCASWGRHTLRAEELARDVESLAADDDNLLAAKELLGDNGGESAKEMALAIDDDLEDAQRSVKCTFKYSHVKAAGVEFKAEAGAEVLEIPQHPQSVPSTCVLPLPSTRGRITMVVR